jgi:uncharacterized protein
MPVAKPASPGSRPHYRDHRWTPRSPYQCQKGIDVSEQYPPQSPDEPAPAPQQQHPVGQPSPQYGQPYPAGAAPATGYSHELSVPDQRMWGMLAHLSGLVTSMIGLSFLGPLVVYLMYKDRGEFVRRQSAEALNFQILLNVILLATGILSVVTLGLALLIVVPLWIILGIAALVLMILAAVKANAGENYRYPLNWRLVR